MQFTDEQTDVIALYILSEKYQLTWYETYLLAKETASNYRISLKRMQAKQEQRDHVDADNSFSKKEQIIIEEAKADKVEVFLAKIKKTRHAAITKDELQKWVDYANKNGCVIIYDAAYEAYISEENVPHSIYECEGARTCAIELRSFSKNAGFTGVRLGFTVIPKELVRDGVSLHSLWARRHGTKFNGAPYIVQKAGEAVYSEAGKAQLKDQVGYYMRNAKLIHDELTKAGFSVSGGVNAPYIWLETPDKMTSWEFFDYLLQEIQVVGTPGEGFGACGEGYFRFSTFGSPEDTKEAAERLVKLLG